MKLLHYLNENRSISIDRQTFLNALKTNCSHFIEYYKRTGDGLFRATSNSDDYLYIKPSNHIRKSVGVKNYYTWLIDNSNEWVSYPKRSQSVIFINDYSIADTYSSSVYYVIPYNGSKIGICPSEDIWESFDKFDLTYFIDFIDSLLLSLKKISTKNVNLNIHNYKDLINSFNIIEENQEYLFKIYKKFNYTKYRMYQEYLDSNMTFNDYIHKCFDPQLNKFKLINTNSLNNIPNSSRREMWTDGECLLLYYHSSTTLDDILKEL
jgi:hypothetical protein